MRAFAFLLLGLSSCSLAVDTSDLSGGARPDTGVSNPDTAPTDTGTCDPAECFDDQLVVKLADIAPCSAETADKVGCRAKVAAACKSKDPCCYKGGYGPVAFPNAAEATILCFIEDPYEVPLTEIFGAASGCTSSALASRACDNAVHASAKKRGNGTGVLQTTATDKATVIGIELVDEVTDVTWSELTALDSGCTMASAEKQACTNAVQLYCTSGELFEGYLGGIGPLSWTASTATVVCF
jgi:hypothetical protein